MFNLIVSADCEAWGRTSSTLDLSRFCEYTAAAIKQRYRPLDQRARRELQSFPALFLYEDLCGGGGWVGHVTGFGRRIGTSFSFTFELDQTIGRVSPDVVEQMAWDLDIQGLETSRTHWAVKDVDLFRVLKEVGGISSPGAHSEAIEPAAQMPVSPTVFALPTVPRDPHLVALMMPFDEDRAPIHAAVVEACKRADLKCLRADDIWESSEIVQDVFALIFRSAVVVADLSDLNGNVLYETGIAHTLGRPVVPITVSSSEIPFDLKHHRALVFNPDPDGLTDMTERLARRLRHLTT